jgi:hypothetical protein
MYTSTWLYNMIVGVQLSSGNSAPNSANNNPLTIPTKAVWIVSTDRLRVYSGI